MPRFRDLMLPSLQLDFSTPFLAMPTYSQVVGGRLHSKTRVKVIDAYKMQQLPGACYGSAHFKSTACSSRGINLYHSIRACDVTGQHQSHYGILLSHPRSTFNLVCTRYFVNSSHHPVHLLQPWLPSLSSTHCRNWRNRRRKTQR